MPFDLHEGFYAPIRSAFQCWNYLLGAPYIRHFMVATHQTNFGTNILGEQNAMAVSSIYQCLHLLDFLCITGEVEPKTLGPKLQETRLNWSMVFNQSINH